MSIPIFLAVNNTYAPFCATTILSFVKNTQEHLAFFILESDFTDNSYRKIKELAALHENCSVEFIRVDVDKMFSDFGCRAHFSLDMYSRFLIPVVKQEFDKVLYTDVDVIAKEDVKALFETDLNGNIIGAVPWCWDGAREKEKINSSSEHRIFHSGLLLIDSKKWREQNVTNILLKKAVDMNGILECGDQDILNIYFDNNYCVLPQKYCVLPCWLDRMAMGGHESAMAIKTPAILHYATGGLGKPWNNPALPYAQDFWDIAALTPFYIEILDVLASFSIPAYMEQIKVLNERNAVITKKRKKQQKQILWLGAVGGCLLIWVVYLYCGI